MSNRTRPNHIVTSASDDEEQLINEAWPLSGAKSRQDWLLKVVLPAARRLLKKARLTRTDT